MIESSTAIQIVVTIGGIFAAMFSTYRYSLSQENKKEKAFLDYIQEMQDKQLEYYTQKNGHLERISEMFSKTINKNTRALDKLSARIKDKQK